MLISNFYYRIFDINNLIFIKKKNTIMIFNYTFNTQILIFKFQINF
jgi:hypothetical protein